MGFRDIHAFNLAILAKQARQLIQGSHSLFYRVYKAHYFPVSNKPSSAALLTLGHDP